MSELIIPEDTQIVRVEADAVGAIVKSEVEAQLDAAHKYPRSIKRFVNEAQSMATLSQETAEMCIYSLPRDGKMLVGPSVRLAEICASAYGNLHIGARVLGSDQSNTTAQGVAWDLERNVRVTVEVQRRITTKNGRRFSDDMVIVTGNAAASVALRNAVFRVIPKAYVNLVFDAARKAAVGDAKTLGARRAQVVDRLKKLGVPQEQILARVGKPSVVDMDLDDVETLIGLGTAIKSGDLSIDAAFPTPEPVAPPEQDGQRMKLGKKSPPKAETKADAKPAESAQPAEEREREPGED